MSATAYRLTATCPEELVSVVAAEVAALGGTAIEPAFKAVHFSATPETYYAAHIRLRVASRILRVVRQCPVPDLRTLFEEAARVSWADVFDPGLRFHVEVTGDVRNASLAKEEIARRFREAVVQGFAASGGPVPPPDSRDARVTLVAHVHAGHAILSVDTAGKSLDKRGYRKDGHPAPLKETLAAGVLRLAGYDGGVPILDPFCGSGTLAIEAASIALDKAPNIHRKKGEFGFEWLRDFDRNLWRKVQDQARAGRRPAPLHPVEASDLDAGYVDQARANALRARVERYIAFSTSRFQDRMPPASSGLLVANLPYGERIGSEGGLRRLYADVGRMLALRYAGWDAALLVADESPWQDIGLRPDRVIPLRNGPLPARLLCFRAGTGRQVAAREGAPGVRPPGDRHAPDRRPASRRQPATPSHPSGVMRR